MAGVLAGAPLDIVRIRQQQPGAIGQNTVKNLLKSIVVSEGGLRSLFKGMTYPLATSAIQNAVCFHAYGVACRYLMNERNLENCSSPLPSSGVFIAGCFAGALQTVVVTPVDLLKIKLQLQRATKGDPGYIGPFGMLKKTISTHPVRNLYKGTVITAIRDIPSHGIYFAVFEASKELLGSSRNNVSASIVWASGGLAGALSWLSVYPFDVIKSRVQASKTGEYKGWIDCAIQSWKMDGPSVFVRGLNATLGRAVLVNAAIFTAYEASHKAMFNDVNS